MINVRILTFECPYLTAGGTSYKGTSTLHWKLILLDETFTSWYQALHFQQHRSINLVFCCCQQSCSLTTVTQHNRSTLLANWNHPRNIDNARPAAWLSQYPRFQFTVNNLVIATAHFVTEAVIAMMTLQFKAALTPSGNLKYETVEQNWHDLNTSHW